MTLSTATKHRQSCQMYFFSSSFSNHVLIQSEKVYMSSFLVIVIWPCFMDICRDTVIVFSFHRLRLLLTYLNDLTSIEACTYYEFNKTNIARRSPLSFHWIDYCRWFCANQVLHLLKINWLITYWFDFVIWMTLYN